MRPGSEEEDRVKGALDHIGLTFVARNHVMRRADGSDEGEVDLVYAHGSHTFVIEVSANQQRDARRRKRKMAREWDTGDRFARLSSELGLPAPSVLRTVYVDLSWHVKEGEPPDSFNGGIVLGDRHVDDLTAEGPERGLGMFLEWNGL